MIYSICNICNVTLFSCRSLIDILITEVDNTLKIILPWFDQNGMVASPAKFRMRFLGKKSLDVKLYLNVNGKTIPEDEQVKLLGVAIDYNLNFSHTPTRFAVKYIRKPVLSLDCDVALAKRKPNFYWIWS